MRYNPVGWFEIYVEDIDRATKFYEAVLGTKLEKLEAPMANLQMMAFPMNMESPGASGALCRMDGVKPGGGGTLVYFATEDCGIEASRIETAGGQVQMPKTSIGPYGFIALGIDTEGNMFGLHSPPTDSV
jgi:predicted enzyme related to lactoylglutathione lyase